MLKKNRGLIILLVCIVLVLTTTFCIIFIIINHTDPSLTFKNTFNLSLPKDNIKKELYDSYGSSSEGERVYSFTFTKNVGEEVVSKINSSDSWKRLPLSDTLSVFLYGGTKNGKSYAYNWGITACLLNVKNGYWKFVNTNPEKDILNAHSFDLSVAIYDSDKNIMYYFKLNT